MKNKSIALSKWPGKIVPFDAITDQFGLKEQDVIELMRKEMKRSSFNL